MAKKPKKFIGSLLVFLIIIVLVLVTIFIFPDLVNKITKKNNNEEIVYDSDSLSIHFLELGNKYTGDAVYIKAGETDILIDAGSRQNSAETITNYLNKYVTDNKLEYVIATHGHQDHIAGFVGKSDMPGIFDAFKCETIIDFAVTKSTTSIISKYYEKRDAEVTNDGAVHYTALECYNNQNGAKRTYELSKGIEMEILYNYYYENVSSDENNHSVCLMIKQGSRNFLFTGDLEKDGEERLVKNNILPEVEVFKGGHHGSYTASNECLLKVIKPKIVCVCCCAGSDEYTSNPDNMFPSQAFITRISKYTDQVYITTLVTEDGYTSFNGNITINSKLDNEIVVNCSNNNIILKESDWFKKNRVWG